MDLTPGTTLLHYRLVDRLGEGGMGVVWRARDTVLDREVAVKVLPAVFTADPERLARFEREAKLLASLSHPRIAGIHGLHDADGTRFLAMELVSGEDLARRLARGPMPMDEAVDAARQIADALEAAHESGIVHRDLKPANVVLSGEGKLKILDFGLAKALEPEPPSGDRRDPSASPTLTGAGTALGVILGTAAYMSPEQARGRSVDRRADIWAFGVVLYEMLTGSRLFEGETISDTLAAVLTREPDWSRLPPTTPAAVRRLLERCLDRDPRRRLRDIGEARVLLESPIRCEPDASTVASARPRPLPRILALAAIVSAITAAAGAAWLLKPTPTEPVRRLSLASPIAGGEARQHPWISPDGRSLVYTAGGQLWIQDLDQLTARPVPGGDGAGTAVWSPDGGSLAFVVGTRLYRADRGGDASLVADLPTSIGEGGGGMCWTRGGTIVYSTGNNDLFEVSVSGGTPRSIQTPTLGVETDFHEPSALPDGRGLLYVVHRSSQGLDTLEVLADGRRKVVYQENGGSFGRPVYSPTGHVLFDRSDASIGIWALPFSLEKLEATGDPVLLTAQGSNASVSREGTLLYSNVVAGAGHQLVTVDRNGTHAEEIQDRMQHVDNVRLSPDGSRFAACVSEGRDDNLWLFDLERRSRRLLVHDARCGTRRGKVSWSGQGTRLLFGNTRTVAVQQRRADGAVGESIVTEGLEPTSSVDGRVLVFVRESSETLGDLWWMRMDGAAEPEPLLATPAREDMPALSPDGSLLAYVSEETGREEVYLQDFPEGAATWQVSGNGGSYPRWSTDGMRLYFVQDDDLLIEAEIQRRPELMVTRLTTLFAGSKFDLGLEHGYDVFGAGERFLTIRYVNATSSAGDLTLVTGWRGPE